MLTWSARLQQEQQSQQQQQQRQQQQKMAPSQQHVVPAPADAAPSQEHVEAIRALQLEVSRLRAEQATQAGALGGWQQEEGAAPLHLRHSSCLCTPMLTLDVVTPCAEVTRSLVDSSQHLPSPRPPPASLAPPSHAPASLQR